MLYLVQRNVFVETNYDKLIAALLESGIAHEIIDPEPRSETVHFRTDRKDVFVYGSVKPARLALNYDWNPGSFYGGNHVYDIYAKAYGEHLLNCDSTVGPLGDKLHWEPGEVTFIRPAKDAKVFTGKTFTQLKREDFVYRSLTANDHPLLYAETSVQVSTPKKIFRAARTWIVGGKVVTSSWYRFHDNSAYTEGVAPEGLAFAQRMADRYCVAAAFVPDTCATPDGWKIVEVNCINSAGFYHADVAAPVAAPERFFG